MATFLCPRTTCLRALASSSRTFAAPTPYKAAFSTSTARPLTQPQPSRSTPRPSIVCRIPSHRFTPATVSIRHESSAPATGAPQPPTSSALPELLTWDRFFDLRRKRRYINLVASLATAAASVAVLGPLIAQQDFDSWGAQMSGLDPMIVLGISGFAVAGFGWLAGPSIGNQAFRLWAGRKGWNALIRQKEISFYARIKQYRADPASSSPQNPLPDYYGEKIASVKDYRRWLKDQRAFNLKKSKNML